MPDKPRKPELRLDWCSYAAAKWACEHWHYSGRLSKSRNVYIGVWEQDVFAGVVVFGMGSGNATLGTRYSLPAHGAMAELTRIALRPGHATPVSRVIAIALKLLRKQSPGLRLLTSMADLAQGHHGGIYQAAGWLYTGQTEPDVEYFYRGAWRHHRTVTSTASARGLPSRPCLPKHRYLMPLDDAMRKQIEPLRQPYPKRTPTSGVPVQQGTGGASPTRSLQNATGGPAARHPVPGAS